jgi:hypothetical protein
MGEINTNLFASGTEGVLDRCLSGHPVDVGAVVGDTIVAVV